MNHPRTALTCMMPSTFYDEPYKQSSGVTESHEMQKIQNKTERKWNSETQDIFGVFAKTQQFHKQSKSNWHKNGIRTFRCSRISDHCVCIINLLVFRFILYERVKRFDSQGEWHKQKKQLSTCAAESKQSPHISREDAWNGS